MKLLHCILALGITTSPLFACDDPSSPSDDQKVIARGGAYRDQSLSNRENRSYNRDGNSQRQQSLDNRQDNSEDRQENR